MERLTIPDVRVDEHTTRRSVIDVLAVQEHAMEIYHQLKIEDSINTTRHCGGSPESRQENIPHTSILMNAANT